MFYYAKMRFRGNSEKGKERKRPQNADYQLKNKSELIGTTHSEEGL